MLNIHNFFQPFDQSVFIGSSRQYVYYTVFFLGDFGEHYLFQSYLPHLKLELFTINFVHLLILQGTFCQNFIIFLNQLNRLAFGSTGSSG